MQDDDRELQANLNASIATLAIALLDEPNKRLSDRRSLRFGNNGSIAVVIQGAKRGSWFSHENPDQNGGPLQLIRTFEPGVTSYDDAKVWAREWLALPSSKAPAVHPAARLLARHAMPDADETARIRLARGVWDNAGPVAVGTPADRYLTVARGIPRPPLGWPESIRFHPGLCSLVVVATTEDGTLTGIQQVFLTRDGEKISDAEAERRQGSPVKKKSGGIIKGAAVRLPGDVAGPLLIAEGPETGFSVWAATGKETWIALGLSSMGNIQLPAGRRIVVCRDDDARNSPADRTITKIVGTWRKAELDVRIAVPWEPRRFDKSDFNDVIKAGGVNAVREAIAKATNPDPVAIFRESLEVSKNMMVINFSRFFATCTAKNLLNPPTVSARIDTGTGKTHWARVVAAHTLDWMRKHDDTRPFVFAVSTLALADETSTDFNNLDFADMGLTRSRAEVFRGREAADTNSPGNAMCRNPGAVKDAIAARVNVQSTACYRPALKGVPNALPFKCPFFDDCAYQRQSRSKPDAWFMAHQYIFMEKQEAFGDIAGLVVDEACWGAGFEGAGDGDGIALSLDTLDMDDTVHDDDFATERLRFLRRRIADVLRSEPDGPLRREAIARGMTAEGADEAFGYESRRLSQTAMVPGMDAVERKTILHRFGEHNGTIKRLMMFWTAVEALLRCAEDDPLAAQYRADVSRKPAVPVAPVELSGWASLGLVASKLGPVRALILMGRKAVGDGWRVPTLLLDADLDAGMMQWFWPYFVEGLDFRTDAPHQHITQVVSRSGISKQYLKDPKHLRKVATTVDKFFRGAKTGLVILNKEVEERYPTHGPNVNTMHYGAVRGIDKHKYVDRAAAVGAPTPTPLQVERLAMALTGEYVEPLKGWYLRRPVMRGNHVHRRHQLVRAGVHQPALERPLRGFETGIARQRCAARRCQSSPRSGDVRRCCAAASRHAGLRRCDGGITRRTDDGGWWGCVQELGRCFDILPRNMENAECGPDGIPAGRGRAKCYKPL